MTITITISSSGGGFPGSFWGSDFRADLHLPGFFEKKAWKEVDHVGPPPDASETREELERLLDMQHDHEERRRRRREILREAKGEFPYFHRVLLYSPSSHPHTYTLVNAMVRLGGIAVMHFKDKYNRPRPSQMEPELRPLIDVPGHPAYPSGHATQMHLAALTLSSLGRNLEVGDELTKIAGRIAENREWAGVHYRSDSIAGERLARGIFPQAVEAYGKLVGQATREWR